MPRTTVRRAPVAHGAAAHAAAALGPFALVLSLAASGAVAQDLSSDWDADGDAMLDPAEWSDGIGETDLFDELDIDRNGMLDRDEWDGVPVGSDDRAGGVLGGEDYPLDPETFGSASFDLYDDNDDGLLDGDELGGVGDGMGLDG